MLPLKEVLFIHEEKTKGAIPYPARSKTKTEIPDSILIAQLRPVDESSFKDLSDFSQPSYRERKNIHETLTEADQAITAIKQL